MVRTRHHFRVRLLGQQALEQPRLTFRLTSTQVDDTVLAVPTTYADPGDGLATVVALRQLADQIEADAVARAIRAGRSLARVAEATGLSRQAVHKKHAKRLVLDAPRKKNR